MMQAPMYALPRHLHLALTEESVVNVRMTRLYTEQVTAPDYSSVDVFNAALLVFNKTGERQLQGRFVQDWYFRQRQRVNSTSSQTCHCHRCNSALPASRVYYVDVGKLRHRMEEFCQSCMLVVLRHHVGDDEADIRQRATTLMDWVPCIDAPFADTWMVQRTYFHDTLHTQ